MSKATLAIQSTPAPRTATYHGNNYAGLVMGQRYTIRVTNSTAHRVEAVVTVDGKDSQNGEPGSTSHRGMIVPAYGSTVFDGWRTSNEAVAAFELSPREDSFAALTTGDSSVGVIGLAIFEEKQVRRRPAAAARPAVYRGGSREISDDDYGATRGGMSEGVTRSAGTAFGAEVESRVTSTAFERATTSPAETHALVYDDVETLIAQGILPAADRAVPDPFPADAPSFCKAPVRRAHG